MKIKRIIVGEEQTNCYVVSNGIDAIIIDPGDNGKKIAKYIEIEELKVQGILLTHGHLDHTMAMDMLADKYQCPCYIHKADTVFLKYSSSIEGSFTVKQKVNYYPDKLTLCGLEIHIVELPGHTDGSIGIVIDNCIFSGDVIFEDGIGRYDLYGGNKHDLENSIQFIKDTYEGYICYPGHEDNFIIS